MCNIRRIDEFLEQWPDAEFGPGHVVLGDANIEDAHVDFSLGLLDSLLDGTPWPCEDGSLPKSTFADDDRECLVATREFLRAFREIPERERIEEGDVLCEGLR